MSDVIDFNELKNKVRDKDIDDFEAYIFQLYGDMGSGKISLAGINGKIMEYMQKNSISQEKFVEIQKKLMERYGVSMEDFSQQMNLAGNPDYDNYRKTLGFTEKYKGRIKDYSGYHFVLQNEHNDLSVFLHERTVLISSKGKIDLQDNALNEFLVSYKKLRKDEKLDVRVSENYKEYEY